MKVFNSEGTNGPLKGVKVVDLTRALAGPTCTMILADMGAETIKIEQPKREMDPVMSESAPPPHPHYPDRNKKNITLDIRKEKGKEIFTRLVQWADVVVENFRPGYMARVGFDFPALQKINPRLILTSISGYGQTGPYAQRAAFDTVGQAIGGLMSATGPADLPPTDAGAAVSDISAGIFGALGTLLALYHQKGTGVGQHVDVSLVESIVFLMGLNLQLKNMGNPPEKGTLFSPKRTPGAGRFLTRDNLNIIIMAQSDQHWPIMARLLGREDLATDPDYIFRDRRAKHGNEIQELMVNWVSQYTINEVEAILERAGLPFGRVQSVDDLLEDPHLQARNRFFDYDFLGKTFKMIAPYPVLSETPGSVRNLWPTTAEHNEEIYSQLLKIPPETLETLKAEGVI
jgi:formyl-CoA transferase